MNNHKTDILNHEKILSVIKALEQNPAITQRASLFGKLAVAARFIALTIIKSFDAGGNVQCQRLLSTKMGMCSARG